MKYKQLIAASALTLAACSSMMSAARADSVLYDSTSFITGQQGFVQTFNLSTPGTLSISISNIPWLDSISNLTYFFSSSSGTLGTPSTSTSGTETLDVTAGTVYAHWFGTAQGNYGTGVLGVKVTFTPGSVSPVPLPASLILLLSGFGILLGWQRRIRPGSAAYAVPGVTLSPG